MAVQPKEHLLNSIAARYDALADTACCLSCGGAVNFAAPRLGDVCLDLGSGKGLDVIKMAEQVGPEGMAFGLDTAAQMRRAAARTAKKLGVTNAEFLDGTFDAIPLEDCRVDLVISNCAINHAPDKDAVWREVYRVLKPGGQFVVSDIYATAPVPERYRTDPQAVAECWAGAVTKETYMAQLQGAGFSNISVLEESAPYPKGHIEVVSFTVSGRKPVACGCTS